MKRYILRENERKKFWGIKRNKNFCVRVCSNVQFWVPTAWCGKTVFLKENKPFSCNFPWEIFLRNAVLDTANNTELKMHIWENTYKKCWFLETRFYILKNSEDVKLFIWAKIDLNWWFLLYTWKLPQTQV